MSEVYTKQEVERFLMSGNEALLRAMEIVGEHGNPMAAGEWGASFMKDVPPKARKDFKGKMTEKQQKWALKICCGEKIMEQLKVLLPVYLELGIEPKELGDETELPTVVAKALAEDAATTLAKDEGFTVGKPKLRPTQGPKLRPTQAPKSQIDPLDQIDYADDPTYGMF